MSTENLNEKTPEELRVEIQKTRKSLAHKASCLGQELEQVGDEVLETMKAKFESAQELLSLDYHMDRHPWGVIALAVVAGAATNRMLNQPEEKAQHSTNYRAAKSVSPSKSVTKAAGAFQQLAHTFEPEIHELREHLIDSGKELMRDLAQQTLPPAIARYFTGSRSRRSGAVNGEFHRSNSSAYPRERVNGEIVGR